MTLPKTATNVSKKKEPGMIKTSTAIGVVAGTAVALIVYFNILRVYMPAC